MTCPANGPCDHYSDRSHNGCRSHYASFPGDRIPYPCEQITARLDGWCDRHRPVDPITLCVPCDQRLTAEGIAEHFRTTHPELLEEFRNGLDTADFNAAIDAQGDMEQEGLFGPEAERGPILIECEGSGHPAVRGCCSMCGVAFGPIVMVPVHQRDDIWARTERGDF